jgi:YD repeat-containing protein
MNNKLSAKPKKAFLLAIIFLILTTSTLALTYDTTKNTIDLTYDENNRILNKSYSTDSIFYIYDQNLNNTLTTVSNDNTTISYNYDNKKRVTKETKTIDGYSFTRESTYNSQDRILSTELNNLLNFTYSTQNLISSILNIVNITHNENNKPINRTYNNQLTTNFTYNPQTLRLTEIKTTNLQGLDYQYDSFGNVIEIYDTISKKNSTMTYDNLHRLINAKKENTTDTDYEIEYTYNSIGNILQINKDGDITIYEYSDLAHAPSLISDLIINFTIKDLTGSTVASFGSNGNLDIGGACRISDCDAPPADSFIIKDNTGNIVSYIDNLGNLCLEEGTCADNSNHCNNPGDSSFIVKNSMDSNVAFINSTGSLCLTGDLRKKSDNFYISNSTTNVASFGDDGNIKLSGTCTSGEVCSPPANSFIVQNATSDVVAYVDDLGNLCIETGDCSGQSPNCNAPNGDSFIVKDNGDNNAIYIDKVGDLCLVGTLTENVNL